MSYQSYKGSFNNYVDTILQFFAPPLPLCGQFYTLSVDKRHEQIFFDPFLPLSFLPRSYWMAPKENDFCHPVFAAVVWLPFFNTN